MGNGLPPATDHLQQEATADGDSPVHIHRTSPELPEALTEFVEKGGMGRYPQEDVVCVGLKVLNNYACAESNNSVAVADHCSMTSDDRGS